MPESIEICSSALRSRVLADAAGNNTVSAKGKAKAKAKSFGRRSGKWLNRKVLGRKSKRTSYCELDNSAMTRPKEWLHPEHHIETGVECRADYVGSAVIADRLTATAAIQDAVLGVARKIFRTKAKTVENGGAAQPSVLIDISSTEVLVDTITGTSLFSYGLDLVPFASCDAHDPTKIYFVTAPPKAKAMLHLFEAPTAKEGLAYTFTMAQAFHQRWNSLGASQMAGPASPTRATSPTGGIAMPAAASARRALSPVQERRARQPPATLGTHLIGLTTPSLLASASAASEPSARASAAPPSPAPQASREPDVSDGYLDMLPAAAPTRADSDVSEYLSISFDGGTEDSDDSDAEL
mmetsp:Transcript_31079/g.93337  ORF Transcript_31079/g.93337 Transcript_31079/m.93337 type:complete len:353 (+) Transcript_31079:22-1080(+)